MNRPPSLDVMTFARLVESPRYTHRALLARAAAAGDAGPGGDGWDPAREALRAYFESHNDPATLPPRLAALRRACAQATDPARRALLQANADAIEGFGACSATLRALRPTDGWVQPQAVEIAGLCLRVRVDLEVREADSLRRLIVHWGPDPIKSAQARTTLMLACTLLELGRQRVAPSSLELLDLADDRVYRIDAVDPRVLARSLDTARSLGPLLDSTGEDRIQAA
jgi:hypothetical protein